MLITHVSKYGIGDTVSLSGEGAKFIREEFHGIVGTIQRIEVDVGSILYMIDTLADWIPEENLVLIKRRQQPMIDDYLAKLKQYCGDKLLKVILYGSYARGDWTDESDMDMFVLLDATEEELQEKCAGISNIGYDVSMDYEFWYMINTLKMSLSRYLKQRSFLPILQEIAKDGIVLYEKPTAGEEKCSTHT